MKKIQYGILISLFLFLFISSAAHSNEERSTKLILDNGMTLLVAEMPSSPVVSVYALVQTGSATEGKFLGTGISHFLEHMLFKGTHGRDVGEVAARIQAVGGRINAATSKDYTIYTITVPFDHFDTALDILSDMLMNSTIESQEVERERNVIFGEMRMHRDNPDRRLNDIVSQNVYIRHPYRHPIIGYQALLAKVTPDDLVEYYRTHYTPNNTIFSVAGNIDKKDVILKIKDVFKDFQRGPVIVRNLPEEPTQITERRYEEEYQTDLTRLSMSFGSTSLLHPDLYALDVLAKILGQGKSSRLYLDVYKRQGLVHSISAFNYTPIDRGIFGISCLLEQKNVEAVIKSVLEQIDQIKKSGVKPEELEKAKEQVRSEYVFGHQTASSVTYAHALDEAFSGDYLFSQKYVESIDNVTNDDIKRVAREYLIRSNLTTVVLKPEQRGVKQLTQSSRVLEQPIREHVLDNGLTVLLKRDETFPLVSMRLTANGGVRQESSELNGLSSMMASTWTKGTVNHSANTIAEKTERLGMQLSTFSGRNSFGLSLEFLTEHLPVALDLLKELVTEPIFPEEEISIVKENMRAAIRQRDDSIFQSTAHVLKRTLFLTHPFRLWQKGTIETIDRIKRDDLVSFYDRLAVPSNMVLSVFGDINPDEMLTEINQMFASMKDRPVTLQMHSEEPPSQPREEALTMDKEQAMVMLGFQGVALKDKDYYGIEILTNILGSSFSGRIFTNIRDQLGNAYTLGGQFIPGPDIGFIYFYVLTTKDEVERVEELLKKEIKNMQSKNVSVKELNDIKTYLKGTFKASQETSASLSLMVSLDKLYGLGYDRYKQYDDHIDRVTAKDIRRLAKKYLDLKRSAIVVTTPKE